MNDCHPLEKEVCCPVCRARQEWSDTCRRCRCDLSLLRRTAEACAASRRLLLAQLDAGRWPAALAAARRYHALCPTPDSTRLLAIASLLAGDWSTAAAITAYS